MNQKLYFLKKYIPLKIRKRVLSLFNFEGYREFSNRMSNPYKDEPDIVGYENSPIKVGIVYSKTHYHKFWIAACRDKNISYQIIYLEKMDWQDQINKAKCDIILVWPDITNQIVKTMQDERLRVLVEDYKIPIYPSIKEIWLYENKRVQQYWLKSNNFPIAKTWVFYEIAETVEFLKNSNYPLVFKSNLGASASGVYIVKNKTEAIKKAKQFISKGYKIKGSKSSVSQKGSLYIQEFISNAKEWRMVRIGNSYFGHGKDMKGQFHSGSGKANYEIPPIGAFELLKLITDRGNFTSMDVDIFEDSNGNLYVNELQTMFGTSIAKEQMKKNGVPGRYLIKKKGEFQFEAGNFCENHLCNLRLQYLLDNL